MNKTIEYYNNHAQAFYERTIEADLSASYHRFLKHITPQATILDAGCGVGRDSKYFLDLGYSVTAFDASQEMVTRASQETGLDVTLLTFQEMQFEQQFNAVWAQASLIHVPYNETKTVFKLIHQALKPAGIFYGSYKYGTTHMPTAEREFWNMDEKSILPYLEGLFDVVEIWTERDTRSRVAPSPDGMWLHCIVRKK